MEPLAPRTPAYPTFAQELVDLANRMESVATRIGERGDDDLMERLRKSARHLDDFRRAEFSA